MRLSHLVAASVLAMTSYAFAVAGGNGVAGIGTSSHVATGFNTTRDTYNAPLGFSGTQYNTGRDLVIVTLQPATNTHPSNVSVQAQGLPMSGSKGYSTENSVVGRNDPMPIVGGRGGLSTLGGLGQ